MENKNSTAKTVLLSTLLTSLLLLSAGYLLRSDIVRWLAPEDQQRTEVAFIADYSEPIADAVEKVNPAVVSVVVTRDVPIYERYFETLQPWGWFGGITVPRVRENGTEEREVGGGTGFIVSEDGLVVTNHHVVADAAARYSILMFDGTVYDVDVLDSDPEIDIAILQIRESESEQLPTVSLGDSSTLRLGQSVIAIGNALAEFQNSVSVGVVSGLARNIVATDAEGMREELRAVIQTDAAINPGNSGGPLLNIAGEVIGVNVATSRGADNIGFAIPVNLVRDVVVSVQTYGEIVQPYLGVRYAAIDSRLAATGNLPVDYGALLVEGEEGEAAVLGDSPAAVAGLRAGDLIVAVGGVSLDGRDLSAVLREFSVGQLIAIEVIRDEEYLVFEATLGRSE